MKQTTLFAALVFTSIASTTVNAQQAVTYTFQDGLNGYAGTHDTIVRSNVTAAGAGQATNGDSRGLAFGALDFLSIDGDDGSPGSTPNQGLIRFENLFGSALNQIKPTDTITSATLRLNVFDVGSGMTGYNMTSNWSELSTWNSLIGGVNVGTETQSGAVFNVGTNNSSANVATGQLSLNVLSSLLAWKSGAIANQGWLLNPFVAGTNGIDFRSSEYVTAGLRPELIVNVVAVPEPAEYAMLLMGLGLVGAVVRRRSNQLKAAAK